MPMTPYGRTNGLGGYNSGDVDWAAFYNNMGAGENNPLSQPQQTAQATPYNNPSWGASRSRPVSVPGTPNGSTLVGKNQTQFAMDNPLQAQPLAYNGQQANPALQAANGQAGGTPYMSKVLAAMMARQGADPGMGGLTGDMTMNPGIPPQQPPATGGQMPVWKGQPLAIPGNTITGRSLSRQGFRHNGSTGLPPVPAQGGYSSGGYLFDANGAQIGRDPKFANRPRGSRGTAAGSDNNSRFETTAVQRANYDRQGISY